jgi:hypothetical protein
MNNVDQLLISGYTRKNLDCRPLCSTIGIMEQIGKISTFDRCTDLRLRRLIFELIVSYEQALYKWWGILLRDFVRFDPTDEPVNTAVA